MEADAPGAEDFVSAARKVLTGVHADATDSGARAPESISPLPAGGAPPDDAGSRETRDATSVNDLTLHLIVQRFEMRNFQGAHRLNGHGETLIGAATRLGGSEPLSRGSQDAKHLRPIESLTFTVITEAHVVPRLRKKSVHRSCVANILPSTGTW